MSIGITEINLAGAFSEDDSYLFTNGLFGDISGEALSYDYMIVNPL